MQNINYDALKLENQLCFPLYACAKEIVARYKPYLSRLGITYTQYIALMVLWEHGSVSVSQLGEYLYLDSGTLTPMLKRLESKNIIRRERSREDERQVNILLTEEGLRLRERAIEIPAKMKDCIALEPQEAVVLYRLLYKMLGQTQQQEEN